MNNLRNIGLRQYCSLIFLLSAVCLLTACGDESIASTDSDFEANLMFDVLYSRGLHVKKLPKAGDKPSWNIVIDEGWFGEGEAAVAIQVLNDYGLPRTKESLPENTNPYGMTSPEEVKKRQNREKEIQIEQHLYTLPGVINVSVIIAEPTNDILSIEKTPPTASVSIVQKEPQPKFTIADVQNQVSGSVSDLKPENIHVTVTQQPLREIPLERLAAQRRTNMVFFLGSGLIFILLAILGAVWYVLKRRKNPRNYSGELLPDAGGNLETADYNRSALGDGDEEALNE